MASNNDLLPQATLFKIFHQELLERLKKALVELQTGPKHCNYDIVHQEMDSLVGASRTMGIEWLEQDARTLAAYARFLRNRREQVINSSCHLMLVNVIIELKKLCQELSMNTLESCQNPPKSLIDLFNGLQQKMEVGIISDYTEKHEIEEPIKQKTIMLIVDDSATSRMLFRAHLPNQDNYQLFEADTMEAALEQGDKHHPHIVIMDYNMPDENGVEIALQMMARGVNPIFILLTANVQQAVLDSAKEAGFYSVLEKPINRLKITKILEDLQL